MISRLRSCDLNACVSQSMVERLAWMARAPRTARYIGRNRWPNARLTFSGRCKPRTARL